jgi:hypothetical protein
LIVIASQRVRPEVAGPMTGSAKQSRAEYGSLDCFVAALLAMTAISSDWIMPYRRKRERIT